MSNVADVLTDLLSTEHLLLLVVIRGTGRVGVENRRSYGLVPGRFRRGVVLRCGV